MKKIYLVLASTALAITTVAVAVASKTNSKNELVFGEVQTNNLYGGIDSTVSNEDSAICSRMYYQVSNEVSGKTAIRFFAAINSINVSGTSVPDVVANWHFDYTPKGGTKKSFFFNAQNAYTKITEDSKSISPSDFNNDAKEYEYNAFVVYTLRNISSADYETAIDATVTINKNGVESNVGVIAKVTNYVASVGDQKFKKLDEAFSYANGQSGATTLNILSDIDLCNRSWTGVSIESGKELTIEGNGHTISNFTVSNYLSDGTTDNEATYGCGFIGVNYGTLVVNDLTFNNVTSDMVLTGAHDESQGSSQVGIVLGCNNGVATFVDVNVSNCKVLGYTKIGLLLGHQQGSSFIANHCALTDNSIGLQVDGKDYYPAFAGMIVGYASDNKTLTNGIKLENNTFLDYPSNMATDNFNHDGNYPVEALDWYYDNDSGKYYTGYSATYIKETGHSKDSVQFGDPDSSGYCYETEDQKNAASNAQARINGTNYTSLSDAFGAVSNNQTLKIANDIETTGWVEINQQDKEFTIDLDGHDISRSNGSIFDVYSKVTIKDSKGTGSIEAAGRAIYCNDTADVTAIGVKIKGTEGNIVNVIGTYGPKTSVAKCELIDCELTCEEGINVQGEDLGAQLTLKNTTINATDYAISIHGGNKNTVSTIVDIDGSTINSTNDDAISVNGSKYPVNLTVKDSTVKSTNASAIYFPNQGTLDIESGNFTGKQAIVIKSGDVTINGGTFTATGDKNEPSAPGKSGYSATGDCIYIEDDYYTSDYGFKHVINLTINGGTFISTNAYALAKRFTLTTKHNDGKDATITINGGTFTSATGLDESFISNTLYNDTKN